MIIICILSDKSLNPKPYSSLSTNSRRELNTPLFSICYFSKWLLFASGVLMGGDAPLSQPPTPLIFLFIRRELEDAAA